MQIILLERELPIYIPCKEIAKDLFHLNCDSSAVVASSGRELGMGSRTMVSGIARTVPPSNSCSSLTGSAVESG